MHATQGVTLNEFHLHYIEMNKVKKIHACMADVYKSFFGASKMQY